jgi:hypothetical protein
MRLTHNQKEQVVRELIMTVYYLESCDLSGIITPSDLIHLEENASCYYMHDLCFHTKINLLLQSVERGLLEAEEKEVNRKSTAEAFLRIPFGVDQ